MADSRLKAALQSRFLRDSTILQLGGLTVSGLAFAGTIALTHVLGAARQGEFYVAVAAYALLWFCLNLGLYPVTISQVAKARAAGDEAGVRAWMGYLLKLGLPLALLTLALGNTLAGDLLGFWVEEDTLQSSPLIQCLAVLSSCALLELPRVVVLAGLEGSRRMAAVARVENGQEILRVVLIVAGAMATGDALGPCLGTALASALGSVLALEAWSRELRERPGCLPPFSEIIREATRVPWGLGIRLGIKVGIIRNIDALGVQILPPLILMRFASPRWVAYLRIAQRLVDVGRLFMKGVSRTALPVLSELSDVKDRVSLKRVYWRATVGSGLMIGAGLGLSALVLPHVLPAFLPLDYVTPVWLSFLILLPGTAVVGFSVANDTFYLVTGQLRVAIWLSVLGLIVNTAVLTWACWRWPDLGAAIGLSFTFLWSLTHVSYAGWWFRRHVAVPGGAR